ncbi:MAG: hypothetical protein ACRELU_11625 [Gemmatimonadota bacterium]
MAMESATPAMVVVVDDLAAVERALASEGLVLSRWGAFQGAIQVALRDLGRAFRQLWLTPPG